MHRRHRHGLLYLNRKNLLSSAMRHRLESEAPLVYMGFYLSTWVLARVCFVFGLFSQHSKKEGSSAMPSSTA